jgi:hypothetical protein
MIGVISSLPIEFMNSWDTLLNWNEIDTMTLEIIAKTGFRS